MNYEDELKKEKIKKAFINLANGWERARQNREVNSNEHIRKNGTIAKKQSNQIGKRNIFKKIF
jgi:hypothetical protein